MSACLQQDIPPPVAGDAEAAVKLKFVGICNRACLGRRGARHDSARPTAKPDDSLGLLR